MTLAVAALLFSTLRVGPGQTFERIEAAVSAAKPGDTIEVYPGEYLGTAILLDMPNIKIMAKGLVRISGKGKDYSGIGSTPRAIFQMNPDADNTVIEGFELTGAHNGSHNGAGIRINCASDVTIRKCRIFANDMGVMSNGRKDDVHAAENQIYEACEIFGNGDEADPGYNHNFYLGGTSAYLRNCDIHHSLTGHNVKSRAHYTEIRDCNIHDSANRECDFVEAWDTEQANSNAVILGSKISKDPNCSGNRGTIHFGVEKGTRNGSLYIIDSQLSSPFISPIIDISTPASLVYLYKNAFDSSVSTPLVGGNYVLAGQFNSASKSSWTPKDIPDFFATYPAKIIKDPSYVDGNGVRRTYNIKS